MDTSKNDVKKITLLSDFNIDVLGRYLTNQLSTQTYQVEATPYGQFWQTLEQAKQLSESDKGVGFVWVRPDAVGPELHKALTFHNADHERCLQEVDTFAQAILNFAEKKHSCLVASFAHSHYGYGLLDWKSGLGISNLLAQANLRLASKLAEATNIYLLDSERWSKGIVNPLSPKLWYTAKLPFANAVFQEAASEIKRALETLSGHSKRIVFLDLDNTLWRGIVGEAGWQGLRIGGHDHIGEAFKSFQTALKDLTRRGIQLAIVSKNEQETAFDAIDNHPEMVLRKDDFAGWRINWQDKAANIIQLLEELRLGPASAVFIDDNPAERDRVRQALPEVLVPEWPEDPCFYVEALHKLRCFDTATLSDVDRKRTEMYASDRSRRAIQQSSETDWLSQMGTRVVIEEISAANISRVEQLFNKTNQLNLTTRRFSSNEILEWARQPGRKMYACSVSDKFGDLGLTGIVSYEVEGNEARLVDYILSCRVMARKVEETLLHFVIEEARQMGAKKLTAIYLPTQRNMPTLKVLQGSGLQESAPHTFIWDCTSEYKKPEQITLERK